MRHRTDSVRRTELNPNRQHPDNVGLSAATRQRRTLGTTSRILASALLCCGTWSCGFEEEPDEGNEELADATDSDELPAAETSDGESGVADAVDEEPDLWEGACQTVCIDGLLLKFVVDGVDVTSETNFYLFGRGPVALNLNRDGFAVAVTECTRPMADHSNEIRVGAEYGDRFVDTVVGYDRTLVTANGCRVAPQSYNLNLIEDAACESACRYLLSVVVARGSTIVTDEYEVTVNGVAPETDVNAFISPNAHFTDCQLGREGGEYEIHVRGGDVDIRREILLAPEWIGGCFPVRTIERIDLSEE